MAAESVITSAENNLFKMKLIASCSVSGYPDLSASCKGATRRFLEIFSSLPVNGFGD
jgi:hypothetical protein